MLVILVPAHAEPSEARRLSRSLAHELRHFVQSFIGYAVGGHFVPDGKPVKRPGFPSTKIQTPDFKQHYDPKHPSHGLSKDERLAVLEKLRQQGIDPAKVDWHALDDVEFYTDLADSIDDFKGAWERYGNPRILNDAIRLWTAAVQLPRDPRSWVVEDFGGAEVVRNFKSSSFFVALRKRAPGKWRKAVAEFVKAVT